MKTALGIFHFFICIYGAVAAGRDLGERLRQPTPAAVNVAELNDCGVLTASAAKWCFR